MNYELAKELKDAGFPQHKTQRFDYSTNTYYPALEDLVEACQGHGHDFLLRFYNADATWAALITRGELVISERAATPTEAVAKLYLALNKKI